MSSFWSISAPEVVVRVRRVLGWFNGHKAVVITGIHQLRVPSTRRGLSSELFGSVEFSGFMSVVNPLISEMGRPMWVNGKTADLADKN